MSQIGETGCQRDERPRELRQRKRTRALSRSLSHRQGETLRQSTVVRREIWLLQTRNEYESVQNRAGVETATVAAEQRRISERATQNNKRARYSLVVQSLKSGDTIASIVACSTCSFCNQISDW